MFIYSPNMLKTYQNCPKKFYYKYIEHFNVPQKVTPFEKGKKIHALANYYLQGINISKIEIALNDEEKCLWEMLKSNEYFQKKCYKSEYQISCRIFDYWVGGRLDAVVYDENNYYILDYKTGYPPKNQVYDFQTMIYLLSLSKILNISENLSFVYINLKENKNHVIEYGKTLKNEYEQKIVEACNMVASDKLYNQNLQNCSNCEYKYFCKNL